MENFYQRFAATVERFPERTAIEVQRAAALESFTYAGLRQMAESAAAALAAREIVAGDRCAILAENSVHWCAAYLGAMRLGAVPVPLDTLYKPAQIAALLRDSGARILFTSPKYLAAAQEAAAAAGGTAQILLLHGQAVGAESLEKDFRSGAPAARLPPSPARLSDAAVILYTSGTTSDPKGVVLTHGNLFAEIDAALSVVKVDHRDAILGVLPLFHALAQVANLLLPFAVGARVVYLETLDTQQLLRALAERQISAFACVPQFFYLIHQRVTQQVRAARWPVRRAFRTMMAANGALRRAGVNLGPVFFRRVHAVFGPRMRILVTGGSRFDPAVGRDLFRMGFNILQAYGLTESSAAATVLHPDDPHVDSAGPPLPDVEVKILPAEPGGEYPDGEIAIRGPIVMQGYFGRPEATAEVIRDGWLHTGDLGYLGPGGRLYITGRRKEIIVTGAGKNLYPEEIEAHYLQSPFIRELCIVGLSRPGEPAAEKLHAVVLPDADALRARKIVNVRDAMRFELETLSVQLPSYKRVLSFELAVEDLPRTTTRKLKRFEIERRVRERAQQAAAETPAETPLSEEERAWMERAEVARALKTIAAAVPQKAALGPGASLELDLGLDSMERVELLANLQHAFGARVEEEAAQRIFTVRDLVDAVLAAVGASRQAGTPLRAEAAPHAADAWARLLADAREDDPEFQSLLRPRPVFAAVIFALLRVLRAAVWLLTGFRASGAAHLPARGPYLISPNHQSYLDPFLMAMALPYGVLRQLFFVGASEYFETPRMRRLARLANLIPVDPNANLLRAMQAGAWGLRHGKVLVLFPEGERSIDGEVKRFRKGAAILSTHLQAPIVPVALDGVFDLWARGRAFNWRALLPWNRPKPRLRFGAPLPPPEPVPAGTPTAEAEARYSAAAENLRNVVLEMWRTLRP